MTNDDSLSAKPHPNERTGSTNADAAKETGSGRPVRLARNFSRTITVGIAILLLGGAIVVNWPFKYSEATTGTSGTLHSPIDFEFAPHEMPTLGGWPYRYYISYPAASAGKTPVSRFSLRALFYNIGLAVLAIGVAVLYVRQRTRVVAGKKSRRKITIADILALTLLLALPFGWWKRLEARQEQELQLSRLLSEHAGQKIMSAWVPQLLKDKLPESLTKNLRRIRAIQIEHPSSEVVERLVEHRDMIALRIGGGDYDLRLLNRLAGNPHLSDIRISGRVLDGEAMQWIASNQRLHTLNLMRTNVSAEAVEDLGALPGLRRLNLIHSDIQLSDLKSPGWSRTIRELSVGHPDAGSAASLTIQGWPLLESLTINELESQPNDVAMKVHLENLPRFSKLILDVFQKFDLTLHGLEELERIEAVDFEWETRIPRGGAAPGNIWCSRLDAKNLPVFKEFNCFAVDLSDVRFRNTPKLNGIGIGVTDRRASDSVESRKLTREVASSLIQGLGRSDGPRLINLDEVPLKDVDLAPLRRNERLEQILLSDSGTTIEQWKTLAPMQWLRRLDVKRCPIDNQGIQWVLETFPKLEHFAFSSVDEFMSSQDYSLEIIDRPHLRTVDMGRLSFKSFSNVRIVNSPDLKTGLKLGFVRQVDVVDAPSIIGLAVDGPLPRGASLSGFRDLQFFALGGENVGDDHIQAIAECNGLQTLTLAYPGGVTPDGLRTIANFPKLVSLNLPGCPVTDAVLESWPALKSLTHLDLTDTDVTGNGLSRLLSGNRLLRLSLGKTRVRKSDLAFLADHEGLTDLVLAGVGIEAAALDAVLFNGLLERLDLSDSEIAPEIYGALLSGAEAMKHLSFRNCEIDSEKIARLAARYPKIQFDLTGSNATTRLLAQLTASQRLVDAGDGAQAFMLQQRMMVMLQSGEGTEVGEDPAIIDVQFFADLRNRTGTTNGSQLDGSASPDSSGSAETFETTEDQL